MYCKYIYEHRLSGKPYTAQQRRQKKRYVPHFLTRLSKHKLPTSATLHNISFTHCVGFIGKCFNRSNHHQSRTQGSKDMSKYTQQQLKTNKMQILTFVHQGDDKILPKLTRSFITQCSERLLLLRYKSVF